MNCGIVVVLYHPDIQHVQSLIDGFIHCEWPIVLVDNSSEKTVLSLSSHCQYFHYPENVGIAEAQNVGLNYLFENGLSHAVVLDQDSLFSVNMAVDLLAQYHELEQSHKIAALGPSIHCQFTDKVAVGRIQKGRQIDSKVREVKQIIASGMMLSSSAFSTVGNKETGLFIDGVDHEWCWRANKLGFSIFQSLSVCMPHRQGDDRVKVLGLTFKQGAPIRLYYQMRNVLLLARRGYVPLYWKCRHLPAIPLRYIVNRFYFPDGKKRGHYLLKGLADGISAKKGKIHEPSIK
ncbi:rhamnosyltransferase [Alteromonas sp. 76-1]|uniref:glycosyltransferase family 2 protein n=1 Tax=Alteromonas TaxID=226 RepID=UPI000FD16C22|nr:MULTISPECIES: glycosyltransferase family 2 protein [Alteromonas]MCQ8849696.1 glycosyltransferase family 2 protein [Alteromonas stellipolaris]VEL95939.1 rhamnosyltransferase [Alteromonas sp. 76-1]